MPKRTSIRASALVLAIKQKFIQQISVRAMSFSAIKTAGQDILRNCLESPATMPGRSSSCSSRGTGIRFLSPSGMRTSSDMAISSPQQVERHHRVAGGRLDHPTRFAEKLCRRLHAPSLSPTASQQLALRVIRCHQSIRNMGVRLHDTEE